MKEFEEKILVNKIDSIERSMKRIAAALDTIAVWMTEYDGIDSIERSMKRIAAPLDAIADWMTESDGVVARRYPGNEVVTALYRGDVPYGDVEVVDGHLEASGDDTEEDDRK